ncbi:MAG TPA: SBBP repeat-containing protein, partial [Vicinamibacteria bacterium]
MTLAAPMPRRFPRLLLAVAAAMLLGASPVRAALISFEPNLGQTDPQARFLARGKGYVVFLTPREIVLDLREVGTPLRMRLAGAREAALRGEGLLQAKSHYFLGSDPARWRSDVPSYERVRYQEVYPGIDLLFYGNEGELEYDFEISAGADPRKMALDVSGVTAMRIDPAGDLVLSTGAGPVTWRKPIAYQVRDGERRAVASRYALRGKRRVGFEVGPYDRKLPLVIDPTLAYSTYLGGNGNDAGHAIAVDEAGNAYVAGETASVNFPGTGTLQGLVDAFVTKFNPSGTTRLYSVYVGGDGIDIAWGIAVDAVGNVHLTGDTLSTNFPTTPSGFQRVKDTGRDAFVLKLGASGALAYSTYLGGDSPDEGDRGNAIAVDAAGNMVVTGRTDSLDFPVTAGVVFPDFRGEVFDA